MPTTQSIIITRDDHEQLERLFSSEFALAFRDKGYLKSLRSELNTAHIVNPDAVPPDVVTMNSTVRLRDLQTRDVDTYTLVYPQNANISAGRLSILAPIGTAILGYRVGNRVLWQVPRGTARLRIEELLFQPERDSVAS